MGTSVLVDTDVMIDYLRGHEKAIAFFTARDEQVVLSSIVVAELYADVKGEAEQKSLDELISFLRVVPVTGDIAKAAGLLKRNFEKSHGVNLADAILAATAESEKAELKTLNVKHYPMIPGLKPAYLKS